MQICVIHGSNRKGNTEYIISRMKAELALLGEVSFSDVYLPKELPHFCTGCFSCLQKGSEGGEVCPHKAYTAPIRKALVEADGIIVASPVYALGETAQLKALFDHFACNYIPHRPLPEMFSKVAFVATTTAGAGISNVEKMVTTNLRFWGIGKFIKFRGKLWEADWDKAKPARQEQLEEKLMTQTRVFYKEVINRKKHPARLSTKLLFMMMRQMVSRYPEEHVDKVYWKAHGWLGKKRPWKQ